MSVSIFVEFFINISILFARWQRKQRATEILVDLTKITLCFVISQFKCYGNRCSKVLKSGTE